MRKFLLAAASIAVLAGAGAAVALERGHHGAGRMFGADANNDGALTRQEFDAGRAALFARLDANSDGELAGDEHRRHHRGGHHRMGHMGADANNDGEITRDEFLARPLEMFARLDADHNGSISADERSRMHGRGEDRRHGERGGRQVSNAEFAARGASMFERLDADGDGRVTREEAETAHRIRRTRE